MKKNEGIENITTEFLKMIKLPEPNGKVFNYLIVMPQNEKGNNRHAFYLGVPYVCSALKASGRIVFTLNLNYKPDPIESLKHVIARQSIDVVLTGGFSSQFWEIKTVVDTVKYVNPLIITVVGGAIVSSDPTTAMQALENADYGVVGEGEQIYD